MLSAHLCLWVEEGNRIEGFQVMQLWSLVRIFLILIFSSILFYIIWSRYLSLILFVDVCELSPLYFALNVGFISSLSPFVFLFSTFSFHDCITTRAMNECMMKLIEQKGRMVKYPIFFIFRSWFFPFLPVLLRSGFDRWVRRCWKDPGLMKRFYGKPIFFYFFSVKPRRNK